MRPAATPPSMITLIICTALSVLTLNMILPSLPAMAAEFEVPYGVVNLVVPGYLAVTGVLLLAIGPLSDRFGRRPVLLWCTGIFVLASISCALADNIWMLLAFRVLQGASVAGQVVPRAALRDMFEPNEAASRLGWITMAMALAPMLGPMLGGGLDMLFGWRAGFWLYTALGLLAFFLVWVDLGETNRFPAATFVAQLRLYTQLFTSRRFWGYALCMAFSVGGFFVFITGAPLVAAAWFDLSPAALGLGIGIITGGFMVGNLVTGLLAKRTELLYLIIAGRVSGIIGPVLGLSLFALGHGSVPAFFGSAILVGFGNGLTMANATSGMMAARPDLAGSAAGLAGAVGVAIGAVLTSATGGLVTPEAAPFTVLAGMLFCGILAFSSAVYTLWVERREARLART